MTSVPVARKRTVAPDWLNLPALVAVAIWGGSYIATKAALAGLSPLAIIGVRLLAATPLLLGLVWLTERRLGPKPQHWLPVLGTVLSFALTQLLSTLSIAVTAASVTALLFATSPIFVALLAVLFRQEVFRPARLFGVAISFTGVGLVIGTGPSSLNSATWAGGILALGAGFCWALTILGTARLLPFYSALALTAWSVAGAAVVMLPLTAPDLIAAGWGGLPLGVWTSLVYLTIGANVVTRVLWFISVRRAGSTVTSVYTYLEPVFAMVFAAMLLGERLTALQMVGAAVIFVGITVTKGLLPGRRRQPQPLPSKG